MHYIIPPKVDFGLELWIFIVFSSHRVIQLMIYNMVIIAEEFENFLVNNFFNRAIPL